jgi:2-C-methyl-D-erythritol 4-phosphate cytidylyltransferase/2-C-methyl-D-erythritol 2,4-cyclodiphosphate synthase
MSKGQNPPFHVLIAAAGTGSRAGGDIPKQYVKIGGKAVLRHTIEKFIYLQGLTSLRVIVRPEHIGMYEEAVAGLDLPPPVFGGGTRKESVFRGVQALCHPGMFQDDNIVLIHDAARPFVNQKAIRGILQAMMEHQAATLTIPVADTLVNAEYEITDRSALYAVQTPQAFRFDILKKAHERFQDHPSFTDDAGLVAAMGVKVHLISGSRENFKITTAEDLAMAEKLLGQTETRTGFGYDVHAFDPAPATQIRLGGIDIPHERKLLGHSDADVILHAVTDAILGAIGEGDIGQLFPPSDMQWKNADSSIFVKEALRRVQAKGGRIVNVDITLIAETPKIGPHRERMLARLSEILEMEQARIGLKATTSEGLGFTGRKEGIVAQAVVNIYISN